MRLKRFQIRKRATRFLSASVMEYKCWMITYQLVTTYIASRIFRNNSEPKSVHWKLKFWWEYSDISRNCTRWFSVLRLFGNLRRPAIPLCTQFQKFRNRSDQSLRHWSYIQARLMRVYLKLSSVRIVTWFSCCMLLSKISTSVLDLFCVRSIFFKVHLPDSFQVLPKSMQLSMSISPSFWNEVLDTVKIKGKE